MSGHTIDDVLRELALPLVIEQLSQEKTKLEHQVRKYFLLFSGHGFIAATAAALVYNVVNQPGYERLIIPPALIAIIYSSYRALQNYKSFSEALDELGIVEKELYSLDSH